MQVLQEVTKWNVPNHIYMVLDSGKLWGYSKSVEEPPHVFKTPLSFDKARRQFKVLLTYPDPGGSTDAVVVEGSKGMKYFVTPSSCTCESFKYRRKCKHVDQLAGSI